MDLSLLFFSPFAKQTKLKFEQDFKACWSFFFELKVLNEAKAMFTSQIMISEMVKSLFVVIATQWYQLSFYLVGRLMKRHLSALCSLWWCSASTPQIEGSQKMAARCIFLQQERYKRDFFPVHILLNSTEHKSLLPSFNEYCGFEVELELLRVSSGLLLKTIPSSELKIVWHLLF